MTLGIAIFSVKSNLKIVQFKVTPVSQSYWELFLL